MGKDVAGRSTLRVAPGGLAVPGSRLMGSGMNQVNDVRSHTSITVSSHTPRAHWNMISP